MDKARIQTRDGRSVFVMVRGSLEGLVHDMRSWNNDLFYFNTKEMFWSNSKILIHFEYFINSKNGSKWSFKVSATSSNIEKTLKYFKIKDVGARPSPRAAFGYAQTDNVGFIFGGRCASGRQNDFHRFDFETRTWTLITPSGPKLPCGRSWLSLIYNDDSVLVYGGLDKHDRKWLENLRIKHRWFIDES